MSLQPTAPAGDGPAAENKCPTPTCVTANRALTLNMCEQQQDLVLDTLKIRGENATIEMNQRLAWIDEETRRLQAGRQEVGVVLNIQFSFNLPLPLSMICVIIFFIFILRFCNVCSLFYQ
uniref:Uncharacterized protein n=1 Tax=Oryzias latipes TaxID=8090 RepID=A0A3P9H949_ORYLA